MSVKTDVGLDRFELREILLRGSEFWNNWRIENPGVVIDLRGANLRKVDLRKVDLRRADLREANLRGANLSETNLSEANLTGADLSEAVLYRANLTGAVLYRANLYRADLSEANLHRANLTGADLREAVLYMADLSEAVLYMTGLYMAGLYMAGLSRAGLSRADLSEADLSEADLSEADLSEADLSKADLSEADLSEADLYRASLRGANLSEANLSEANLYRTDLREANLNGSVLTEANLYRTDLSEANLNGAVLRGAVLNRIDPKISEATFNIKIFDQEIDPSTLEEINTAVSNYAEAAGYTDPEIISERRGSFFSDIRYKVARVLSPEVREEATRTGEDLYRRGKANVQARLEQPGVESTKQLAEATAQLLKSIENVDNAILTLGKVIVIKYTNQNGKSITIVRTVSTEIQHQLEEMPHLLNSPRALIKFLNASKEEPSIESAKVINQ